MYNYTSKEAFVGRMLRFNQWGLLPKDQEGPQDNPFLAVPLSAGPVDAVPLSTTKGGGGETPPQVAWWHIAVSSDSGGSTLVGGGAITPAVANGAWGLKALIPGPRAPRMRARQESDASALPRALKKRKWVAKDE